MTTKPYLSIRSVNATAVLFSIAVVVVLCLSEASPSRAGETNAQLLAAELLIVRDDLMRLNTETRLPPAHVRGLQHRIQGSLGVLPWLLRQAGDTPGADQVRTPNPGLRKRIRQLDQLIKRHPLDLSPYAPAHLTPKLRREAFAIHDTYCAGCHDGSGEGDGDTELPARDLFLMAHTSPPQAFLARLLNGVKGDETLLFTNPLTPQQVGALWQHYQRR